jgi:hypothetical protein
MYALSLLFLEKTFLEDMLALGPTPELSGIIDQAGLCLNLFPLQAFE